MISSIIVGVLSGLAASLLKKIVHTLNTYFLGSSAILESPKYFVFFPPIGILLSIFLSWRLFKGTIAHGSSWISYYITRNKSRIPITETFSHLLTSGLTVGFGGSVGLESPMLRTGSAIGANFGSWQMQNSQDRTVLLACGAAAGISAAFNAPIAGVLFVIEILLSQVSTKAFIPIIISSATGALVSNLILSEEIILSFSDQSVFQASNIPFYIILGILSGIVSLYYNYISQFIETQIFNTNSKRLRFISGALLLVLLIFFCPPLFGEGYHLIRNMAESNSGIEFNSSITFLSIPFWAMILMVILLKPLAAGITFGMGGNGGHFGPSLIMGSCLGYLFSILFNNLGYNLPVSNFTLVSMAGAVSGILYAPLSAVFLIAEITKGYSLMIPLMVVSAISSIVVRYIKPVSRESEKLSQLLSIQSDSKEGMLFSRINLESLIETDFVPVQINGNLDEMVEAIKACRRNMFPVLDSNKTILGIIHIDDIRSVIFDQSKIKSEKISSYMRPTAIIDWGENLGSVLHKIKNSGQWSIPVAQNKKYIGCISKSGFLEAYKKEHLEAI